MDTEAITATMATAKNEILAELHKDIFLTPKGMIKLVQLLVVIAAFAMTTSASGTSMLTIGKGDNGKPPYSVAATVHTKYPFNKYSYEMVVEKSANVTTSITDKSEPDLVFKDGFQSESKFYVFVGVVSFLYVLTAVVLYGWYPKFAKMSDAFAAHFTKADLLITIGLTFFWFLSVTLWSAGFAALRSDLGLPHEFPALITSIVADSGADASTLCPAPQFACVTTDSWSKLYGSIVFGYLCVALFGINCWYCFKDTEWHAEPEKLGGILRIRTDAGAAGAPGTAGLDDVNLEAAGHNDTATIQPGAI